MANYNYCCIVGNLTRDPEVKFIPSGTAVAAFGVAVNEKYKVGEDWKERVNYFDVEAWGKLAEICGENLAKGRNVLVAGALRYESWEKDGEKKSRIKIVADKVQFLGAKPEGKSKEEPKANGKKTPPVSSDDDIPF
jgi:single-strand DNA-binding protein